MIYEEGWGGGLIDLKKYHFRWKYHNNIYIRDIYEIYIYYTIQRVMFYLNKI